MTLPVRRSPRAPAPDALPLTWRQWEARVMRWATDAGWLCYHTHDARRSQPGMPDIFALHPAHGVALIECKTGRGTLSAAQQRWRDVARAAGVCWIEARPENEDEVLRVLTDGKEGVAL